MSREPEADNTATDEKLREYLRTTELDMGNDLDFLIRLAGDALGDEHFDDDSERVEWVIAYWCQEVGYLPDLRDVDGGLTIPKDSVPPDRDTAILREMRGN